jgi:hypothetical protein
MNKLLEAIKELKICYLCNNELYYDYDILICVKCRTQDNKSFKFVYLHFANNFNYYDIYIGVKLYDWYYLYFSNVENIFYIKKFDNYMHRIIFCDEISNLPNFDSDIKSYLENFIGRIIKLKEFI